MQWMRTSMRIRQTGLAMVAAAAVISSGYGQPKPRTADLMKAESIMRTDGSDKPGPEALPPKVPADVLAVCPKPPDIAKPLDFTPAPQNRPAFYPGIIADAASPAKPTDLDGLEKRLYSLTWGLDVSFKHMNKKTRKLSISKKWDLH
jgi:hypothetical protein